MAKGHLGSIEMEKIHEFNRFPSTQGSIVYSSWFVVKLEIHGEDLDVLYTNVRLENNTKSGTQLTEKYLVCGLGGSRSIVRIAETEEFLHEVQRILVNMQSQR